MGRAGKSRSHDEWIYGLNPVVEAVRAGRKIRSVALSTSRKDRLPDIEKELEIRAIHLRIEDPSFFDSRFPKGHQGIAAHVVRRDYFSLDDLMRIPSRKGENPLFLILDCLEDPRNFGAIIRVADAGGVHGIVIQEHRSTYLTPEAVKASSGASEHVPIAMIPNIKHAIISMRESGITVMGGEAEIGKKLWDQDLRVPLAIVIGSEGRGLRKTVREYCDIMVSIPMKGAVNSLNASVATGIVIFEVLRQRISCAPI